MRRRSRPTSTSPAITEAAAREREPNRPRSASRVSRRTRGTEPNGRRLAAPVCPTSHWICAFGAIMCSPMTALRLISLPVHGAVEMLVGFLLMVVPFALQLSGAATVVGITAGVLVVGLALSSTDVEAEGRRAMPIATHYAFDYGLVPGLRGVAAILGFTGDKPAAAMFAVAAVLQLALNMTTRYSRH